VIHRTPFPYGKPSFAHQTASASAPAAAPDRRDRSRPRPSMLLVLVGVLLGFGAAWFLFDSDWGIDPNLPPLYDESVVKSVFDKSVPAVVEIRTIIRVGRRIGQGSGSGFFVDDRGHIITNNHVVDDATEITVRLQDGRVLTAEKLGTSRHDDLAVLRVDPEETKGIEPLPFANSDDISPGEMAIAIGSPFENFNSVSVGVVSGIGRTGPENTIGLGSTRPLADMIQTDAALNPGNSGGPLLNVQGEVIGVNSSVQIVNGVQIGVGFAVASNTVQQILDNLKQPGEFTRPWIGFSGDDVEDLRAQARQLAADTGIYVTHVCNGGPAATAGVRDDWLAIVRTNQISGRGDIITGVDGKPVSSMADLLSYVNELDVGDQITLNLIRNGSPTTADVTLAEWEENCN
jgi:2-alkenal reductase